MADRKSKGDKEKPSFSGFWKKPEKSDKGKGKELKFVPYDQQEPSTSKKHKRKEEASAKEDQSQKSQIRRAQVRKAQLQHRQRKAEYVEQLETDISALNKDIENVKLETQTLEVENNVLRQSISGVSSPQYPTFSMPHDPSPLSYGVDPAQGYTMGSTVSSQWNTQAYNNPQDPTMYSGTMDPNFQDFSYTDGSWYPEDTGVDDYVGEEDEEDDQTLGFSSAYGNYLDEPSYYSGGSSAGPSGGHM